MNGKKSKLLRKLAKMSIEDKTQPFKVEQKLSSDRRYALADGKTITMKLTAHALDRTCGRFIQKQMKKSYRDMKPLYRGMKSHKV